MNNKTHYDGADYLCKGIFGSIIIIAIIAVIYFVLGFRLSFSNYDPIVTREWAKITLTLLALNWSVIAVVITYSTLKEQRKQIENINKQHFDNIYQSLLRRQWEIRDKLVFTHDVIYKSFTPTPIELKNERYFEGLYWFWKYLNKANEDGYLNQSEEWESIASAYENHQEQYDEIDWHERPEWCEQQMSNDLEKLKALYAANVFQNFKLEKDGNFKIAAFKCVFQKYNTQHSLYFRHFQMIISFLSKSTKDGCDREDYLLMLKANMSKYELLMLYYYSQCVSRLKEVLTPTSFFQEISKLIEL